MSGAIQQVIFCGAVDDGKSTLLGRVLVETGSVPLDEVAGATTNGVLDYSRLTDGLLAEQEQGITIDVCFRHLRLPDGSRRVLADCPGHVQYTRNMAVAASNADTAVLVIDATRGARPQSYQHASICALMGVARLIVAVNKIDVVSNPRQVFDEIVAATSDRFEALGFESIECIPMSALSGDSVGSISAALSWYNGPTLIASLMAAVPNNTLSPLRFPVQAVTRQDGFRWYLGRIAGGSLRVGDVLGSATGGPLAKVSHLLVPEVADRVYGPRSIAVRFDEDIDIRRGDVLVDAAEVGLAIGRVFLADLIWLGPESLNPDASYLLKVGPCEVPVRVGRIRYHVDPVTGQSVVGSSLNANEIARVEIFLDRPMLLDSYRASRDTGGFILVERGTSTTIAAGLTFGPLPVQADVVPHQFNIGREDRERLNGLRACVLWLTGLPASGKSTIAGAVERLLVGEGIRCCVLDGDMIRATLSSDLGFSVEDRAENARRVAEVARIMLDAGLVVIVSLVSPFREDRDHAKALFADTDFFEVFVDTPLSICVERDPKGLYARALSDGPTEMTGLGQQYEQPLCPSLTLDGTADVDSSARTLVELVLARRLG